MPSYRRRITLANIAQKARVHVTTVSLALRNHPRLPESTRKRIQALARRMGYAPDPLLNALVAYRGVTMPRIHAPTLAYVTNWSSRWGWRAVPAHRRFFVGARAEAKTLGYALEHCWLHESGRTQAKLSKQLYARGIHGLIVASHSREMGDELQFDWPHFSAVKIDYFPHQPPLHNVTNNQSSIIRLAVRKVRAAGYRRIGFVVHRGWDHAVDNNWTGGFLSEQQHIAPADWVPMHLFPALHPVERWFHETNASVVADMAPFAQWLKEHRPEVVIAKTDYVLPLIQQMGLRVPQDLAFVDLFLQKGDGAVAGVRQNHETVGKLAVEILAGQLQHKKFGVPAIATTTFVEGTWFDGASCPRWEPAGANQPAKRGSSSSRK